MTDGPANPHVTEIRNTVSKTLRSYCVSAASQSADAALQKMPDVDWKQLVAALDEVYLLKKPAHVLTGDQPRTYRGLVIGGPADGTVIEHWGGLLEMAQSKRPALLAADDPLAPVPHTVTSYVWHSLTVGPDGNHFGLWLESGKTILDGLSAMVIRYNVQTKITRGEL